MFGHAPPLHTQGSSINNEILRICFVQIVTYFSIHVHGFGTTPMYGRPMITSCMRIVVWCMGKIGIWGVSVCATRTFFSFLILLSKKWMVEVVKWFYFLFAVGFCVPRFPAIAIIIRALRRVASCLLFSCSTRDFQLLLRSATKRFVFPLL